MLNSTKKIAKSEGVDLPVLKVYLAGRISGDNIDLCLAWRKQIIKHYENHKGKGAYPISFLCPLNSGEASSVDKMGLKSNIPSNLIYDKDILSIEHADVIVANMNDFFEEDIKAILGIPKKATERCAKETLVGRIEILKDKILKRRENMGTIEEVGIARYLKKPIILIVPENRKYIFENHPFQKRASVIVSSVDDLLKGKYLELLYKSIASAIY